MLCTGRCKGWAHISHSFDVHLSSLGSVSCAFHPESPRGALSGWLQGSTAWWRAPRFCPESLQAHLQGRCAGRLQHPLFTERAATDLPSPHTGRKPARGGLIRMARSGPPPSLTAGSLCWVRVPGGQANTEAGRVITLLREVPPLRLAWAPRSRSPRK